MTAPPFCCRSCEASVRPRELFQAIKSYLFFSQLSAWLNQSRGHEPTSVAYRISPPGEFCTSSFSEAPDWHIFPLCTLGRGLALKITVGSMPRRQLIPAVLCPEAEGIHCPLRKTKKADDGEASYGAKSTVTRPHKLPVFAEPYGRRSDSPDQHTPARRRIRPLAIKTPTADAMPLQNFQVWGDYQIVCTKIIIMMRWNWLDVSQDIDCMQCGYSLHPWESISTVCNVSVLKNYVKCHFIIFSEKFSLSRFKGEFDDF